MKFVRALLGALSYFTILPVPSTAAPADAFATSFLPFIGVLLGAVAGCAGYGAYLLTHAPIWSCIIAWLALVAMSGAIHVDGFLDACDGLLASVSRERRLEILRDPRHGTYAVIGMFALGVVWLALLTRIAPDRLPLALAITGGVARLAPLADLWIFPYARTERTPAFARRPHVGVVAAAVVLLEALAWFRGGPFWIAGLPVCALAAVLFGAWATRRLGGLTGDIFGAAVVLCELAALALIAP